MATSNSKNQHPRMFDDQQQSLPKIEPCAVPLPGRTPPHRAFCNAEKDISLYQGNCIELLRAERFENTFDLIFADPPYFLSNGGSTCQNGKRVAVGKGTWDESVGLQNDFKFTVGWLRRCQRALKANGTMWVTGTQHNIFVVGYVLQKLGFKILNSITWAKPNPPPNLSCRYFTHSTEMLIWAAKNDEAEHAFNYDLMRGINGGRQMQSVWVMPAAGLDEKAFGEHPTQKPLDLVTRCLLAATSEGDLVLDPFLGSGTTAVACIRNRLSFVGIDSDCSYVAMASTRTQAEIEKGSELFASRTNAILDSCAVDIRLAQTLPPDCGSGGKTLRQSHFA